MTQAFANEQGIPRPSGLKGVRHRRLDCSGPINDTDPFTPEYHRIELSFNASSTAAIDPLTVIPPLNYYEVQRKRTVAGMYATVGKTVTNRFIDPTRACQWRLLHVSREGEQLRPGHHRVHGRRKWRWSRSTMRPTGSPDPSSTPDPNYTVVTKKPLNVVVLKNDSDNDSPTVSTGNPTVYTARRVVLFTSPANGTVTLNPDGSFTYISKNGFSGVDTFT